MSNTGVASSSKQSATISMTATSRSLLCLPLLLTITAIAATPISIIANTDTATTAATTTSFYILMPPNTIIVDPATTATATPISFATTTS